jgi:hypothetical protein
MKSSEKAPRAGHAEGFRNTNHIANYPSILPRCKYSANYEHGLFFGGLLIQILLDCNFIVWVNGQVFHAQSFEALKNIFNNSEN